jgi:hypothetical protein
MCVFTCKNLAWTTQVRFLGDALRRLFGGRYKKRANSDASHKPRVWGGALPIAVGGGVGDALL